MSACVAVLLTVISSDTGTAGSVATTYTIKGSTCYMKYRVKFILMYKRINVLIDTKLIKVASFFLHHTTEILHV